jgi:hypothetical protein
VVNRRFAATFEFITVTAKAQRRQAPLPFNDLAIDIVDIRAITLLTKEGLPRIRGNVIRDIQDEALAVA